ncbi:putative efflux protein, MATE family [Carnobacterium iners]|uniref:Putative efflux protein, MATE family n=1 Tax=Carnobacterium iners TaxID=1073423 RepID=A0A1X7MP55_9LACT|nr:MATE family efflux transporter [Carnobacterium iners]SEK94884.1 putative efflux protein, MATE family [Carnobacterium iners]SMH26629.1 putative efflux protein, MATE family [Carnobacterium iners]
MKHSVLKNFIKYTSVNILGMIGLSLYILADTYFVSKALGSIGIASLNLSISIYSIIHGLGLMIGIGGATKFIILKVQKNENATRVFSTSLKIGLAIGTLLILIGIFGSKRLAMSLGADSLTLPLTQTYLTTILIFAPFFIVNNILLAFVRNDNNPNLSMIAMLVGSFSNIILDYVFIFPLNMGIFGAAFATGLAPIISILVLMVHFAHKNHTIKLIRNKFELHLVYDIFSLGLSSFIIEVSSAVALITFNIVILRLEGNDGVAAYAIVANLALVVIAIFTGLAQGAQPLISNYFGLKELDKLKKTRKYALVTAFVIAFVIYTVTMVFSESFIQIFNSENNSHVAQMADIGLKFYFLGFFFAGINIVTTMVLSATENIREALSISLLRGLILIVPIVLVASYFWTMTGVWFAFVLTELIVTGIVIYLDRLKNKSTVNQKN